MNGEVEHLRRYLFGKPDGWFPVLRCALLGHDAYYCDPDCCGRWWCHRCLAPIKPPAHTRSDAGQARDRSVV